jgi:hypothetical protein
LGDKFWWITTQDNIEDDSGFVSYALARRYKSFAKLKGVVWKWFRRQAGRTDLNASETLVLWAVCERHRSECMACRDSFSYLAKMTGLTPKTVGKSVVGLIEKKVLWLAVEEERVLLKKAKRGGRKHLVLVGLNAYMVREDD